jgi:hypothetical protein
MKGEIGRSMIATTPELSGRFAGVVRWPACRAERRRLVTGTSHRDRILSVACCRRQSSRTDPDRRNRAKPRNAPAARCPSQRRGPRQICSLSCVPRCQQRNRSLLRRIWACWFDNRSAALPKSLMMTFPAYCTDIGIMLLLRLAMIQIEPVMTRKTISTPKARARILFV